MNAFIITSGSSRLSVLLLSYMMGQSLLRTFIEWNVYTQNFVARIDPFEVQLFLFSRISDAQART